MCLVLNRFGACVTHSHVGHSGQRAHTLGDFAMRLLDLLASLVEFAFDAAQLLLGLLDLALYRRFYRSSSVLDVGLNLFELGQLDLTIDVSFDLGHVTLEATQQMPSGAGHARQALGSKHHQGDHADHHQFRETDVEHRCYRANNAERMPIKTSLCPLLHLRSFGDHLARSWPSAAQSFPLRSSYLP